MMSNWVDGCFVSTKSFMNGLRIREPMATKNKKYNRGTGIAHELIKAHMDKTGKQIAQTYYALVEHLGNIDTVMHDARRRHELYGDRTSTLIASSLTPEDLEYIQSKMQDYGIQQG
jgi:preprotein translocase subunit SecA